MSQASTMPIASRYFGSAARILSLLVVSMLNACVAAPPLTIYDLSESPTQDAVSTVAADPPPSRGMPVIEVARVTLPAYLDSQDLIVRRGDVLERSSTARWASRLSIAATELLTAQLEHRETGAWVTDQAPARTADYRLMVHISRLDITRAGGGVVEADWELVPRGASGQVIRRRIDFTMKGSVTTDPKVATFERALLEHLAEEIDLSSAP